MKRLAVVLVCLLSPTPLKGAETSVATGGDCTACTVMEVDRLTALFMDGVLKSMVCRLAHQRFTPARLSMALAMSEGQVLRRLNTLRGWGLVRLVRRDSATTIVEPLPGTGEQTLRRWAARYCSQGDACGRGGRPIEPREEDRRTRAGATVPTTAAGRESLAGKVITVFGGSGFLGRDLARHLVEAGARVRVASRNPRSSANLASSEQSGHVEFFVADVATAYTMPDAVPTKDGFVLINFGNNQQIEAAVDGVDMVVNVVGIHKEVGSQTFSTVNFHGARKIARAAAESGVSRLVHVSSISSEPESPSLYAQAKAIAEANVRGHYPSATVVRPSVVFGPGDSFVNRLASLFRYAPFVPLYGGGEVRYQPVYVGDVSEAIVRILSDPATEARTYELGGHGR